MFPGIFCGEFLFGRAFASRLNLTGLSAGICLPRKLSISAIESCRRSPGSGFPMKRDTGNIVQDVFRRSRKGVNPVELQGLQA